MLHWGRRPATRAFSAPIVLSLTVGIAGVTAFGSVVSRVLSAYGASADLVAVMTEDLQHHLRTAPTSAAFTSWQTDLRSFDRLESFALIDMVLRSGAGTTARVLAGAVVDPGIFELVRQSPVAGRTFIRGDVRNSGAAMISRGTAAVLFGSSAAALGQTLFLDGAAREVVGVFPDAYAALIAPADRLDVVVPASGPRTGSVQVLGLLRPGVLRSDAQTELDAWSRRSRTGADPDAPARWVILTFSDLVATNTTRMFTVSSLGGLVLLIVTCSNLAHMYAARNGSLRKDRAIRWALGATPRQQLTRAARDGLTLAMFGGLAGGVLAAWVLRLVSTGLPAPLQFLSHVDLSLGVLALVTALSWLLMLGMSVPDAFKPSIHLVRDLAGDRRFPRRSVASGYLNHVFIVTMVACSFILSVAGYLVAAAVFELGRTDVGFRSDGLQLVTVSLPDWKYGNQGQRNGFYEGLQRAMAAPATPPFAIATSPPPRTGVFVGTVQVMSRAASDRSLPMIGLVSVSPGYFRVIGQPIVAGREFEPTDVVQSPTAVVISATTAKLFGSDVRAALGQPIKFGRDERRVVGVAADVHAAGGAQPFSGLQAYWPLSRYRNAMTIVMRAEPSRSLGIRNLALGLDPDVVADSLSSRVMIENGQASVRWLTTLFAAMAVVAAALSVLGVYGVLRSFTITQRAGIALRLAIGASPRTVLWWVIWQGLSRSLLGVCLGWLLSYPFCQFLASELQGADPARVLPRVAAAAALLLATVSAAMLPAIRASQVPPSEALKQP